MESNSKVLNKEEENYYALSKKDIRKEFREGQRHNVFYVIIGIFLVIAIVGFVALNAFLGEIRFSPDSENTTPTSIMLYSDMLYRINQNSFSLIAELVGAWS